MTRGLRLAAAFVLLLASATLDAQARAQGPQSSWMAEFPPDEAMVAPRLQRVLASKLADRLLREDPDGLDALQALVSSQREEEAVDVVRRIVDAHPELMARALTWLSTLTPRWPGETPGHAERVQAVLGLAHTKLPALERNARAEAAYALARAESSLLHGTASSRTTLTARLESIAAEFAGTPAALEATVDLADAALLQRGGDSAKRYEDLLAFARAHTGTTAGAKALYLAGFHLGHNAARLKLAPVRGGGDPTGLILRVRDIVRELQDGRYPRCEWTESADRLLIEFFAFQPEYSAENVGRLLAVYASFAAEHWRLAEQPNPADYGIGYLVTSTMADLYKLEGDETGRMDAFLTDLETQVADRFAVRYLRAMNFVRAASAADASAKAVALDKARSLLESIHDQADGLYKRKALATIASRAYYDREWRKARQAFARYVREFPDSPYTWVAALRDGECQEQMGDWRAALATYQTVAGTAHALPIPLVLADVFAARTHEAAGEFVEALALYRRAIARWEPSLGDTYDITSGHARLPGEALEWNAKADTRVDRAALNARAAEMERALAAPGGASLEHARRLLRKRNWQEAARAAARTAAEFPGSPNAADARSIGHRARLEEALERADVQKADADASAAGALLDRLAGEPIDFAVAAAGIARAYLAASSGQAPDAGGRLLDILAKLRASQPPPRPLGALEQDVADIRSQVFRPNGDAIFAGTRWNGFAWPLRPAPFTVTKLAVSVRLADGQVTRLSFAQSFPHLDNVLFVDDEQVEMLNTLMTRLGGTKTREGRVLFEKAMMEPPNQPVGPSIGVMEFLSRGFRVMPGHWSGWLFTTFPTIDEVVFLDGARTKALARVTVGYAGGDVLLEKQDGVWRATRLTQTWVT